MKFANFENKFVLFGYKFVIRICMMRNFVNFDKEFANSNDKFANFDYKFANSDYNFANFDDKFKIIQICKI